MALKIDKEALLKHRFWIMLGVAVPLILFSLYVLRVDIAANEKKIAKVKSDLKQIGSYVAKVPSQEEIDKIQGEVKKANEEVGKVWAKVFAEQVPLMFWPDDFVKEHPFETGKFIRDIREATEGPAELYKFTGTFIGPPEANFIRLKGVDNKEDRFYRTGPQFQGLVSGKKYDVYYTKARYFDDKLNEQEQADYVKDYHTQIRPILNIVEPVDQDGEGVVQLRGWLAPPKDDVTPPSAQEAAVARYLRWVPKWNAAVNISEEAWIAQEDLWIQKEIYKIIRDSNDQVSKMLGAPVEGKTPGTYANPYFEVTLTLLSPTKLQVKLKNLRDNRQKLEIAFRVKTAKDQREPKDWDRIMVDGEPLDPAGVKKGSDTITKELTLGPGNRTGIYEVEQILTWETAAVRRIDHIAIGSAMADEMALNNRAFPEGVRPLVLSEVKVDPDKPNMRPEFGMPQKQGTVNGLVKDRYIEVNEQARRLPVAFALIVDQMHLGRIMKSIENSKLRFVVNQTILNRYPGSIRPAIAGGKDDPVRPLQKFRGGEGGPFGPRPPMMMPTAGGEDTFESNVELVVYGTVTMYQRFPPRPAAPAPAGDVAAKQ